MGKKTKRNIARGTLAVLLLALPFVPGLPWAAKSLHLVKKIRAKAEMKVSAWKGVSPMLVSLTGTIAGRNGPLKGGEVEALDSVSGWAALTDDEGRFVLRDVIWYPGANYTVLIRVNDFQARQVSVTAPEAYPPGGVLNVGELGFERGCAVETTGLPGMNSISYVERDRENGDYYRGLFDQLTNDKHTDEGKMEAICQYVAGKLNAGAGTGPDSDRKHGAPRQVLEKGSRHCWDLALAFATLAEAGNYRTRMVDLLDPGTRPSAHMATEVYYRDRWHMYDPVTGSAVRVHGNRVQSYKEVRLDADFRAPSALPDHLPPTPTDQPDRAGNLYRSGCHHYYYLR